MKALTLCLSILLVTAYPPIINSHASSSLINGIVDPSFETQNTLWDTVTQGGNANVNPYDTTRDASTGSQSAKLTAPSQTGPPPCSPCGDQIAAFVGQSLTSQNYNLVNLPDSTNGLSTWWYVLPGPNGPYSLHIELIFSDGTVPSYVLKYFYGSNGGAPNSTREIFLDLGPVPAGGTWFNTQRDVYRDIQTFGLANVTSFQLTRIGFGALGNYTHGETAWVDDVALMLDRPTAIFSANLMSSLQVSFDASSSTPSSSGTSITRYTWSFGDGQTATSTQPTTTHTYSHIGNAMVTLNIADNRGHLAASSQSVIVSDTGSTLLGTYALDLFLLAVIPVGLFFGRRRWKRR